MLVLLSLHLALALIAPLLVRWWGRRACYPLALAPAAAFAWAVARTGTVRDGGAVTETYGWVRQLHLDLALRLGTLSWLMVLLVGGVGALVLVYCARYVAADEPGLGRFAATFVAFAGAMFGLVVADNLILLYVFWELTTVCSYLLIGHHPTQWASRRAAAQALVVTSLGGLAMLIGLIMLGQHAGTYRISELPAAPLPTGGYLAAAAGADPGRRTDQVRDLPGQLLAAGRDGRPHPGQRLPARGGHGQGRRLPGRAARADLRGGSAVAADGLRRRGGDHARRRLGRAAPDRPEAAAGVRHGQPVGPAVRGDRGGHPGRRARRHRDAARARAVQVGALPRRGDQSTTAPAPGNCPRSPDCGGGCHWSVPPPSSPRRRWPAYRHCSGSWPRRRCSRRSGTPRCCSPAWSPGPS